MTAKRHDWFRFHVTDWLLGTNDLTLEQQAMYIKLLCVQWREGRIPGDLAKIAKLTVTHPKIVSRLCPTLLRLKFNSSPTQVELKSDSSPTQVQLKSNSGPTQVQLRSNSGPTYWKNERLEKERQVQVAKHDRLSEAGRKGGLMSKPPPSIKKEKENKKEKERESKRHELTQKIQEILANEFHVKLLLHRWDWSPLSKLEIDDDWVISLYRAVFDSEAPPWVKKDSGWLLNRNAPTNIVQHYHDFDQKSNWRSGKAQETDLQVAERLIREQN